MLPNGNELLQFCSMWNGLIYFLLMLTVVKYFYLHLLWHCSRAQTRNTGITNWHGTNEKKTWLFAVIPGGSRTTPPLHLPAGPRGCTSCLSWACSKESAAGDPASVLYLGCSGRCAGAQLQGEIKAHYHGWQAQDLKCQCTSSSHWENAPLHIKLAVQMHLMN